MRTPAPGGSKACSPDTGPGVVWPGVVLLDDQVIGQIAVGGILPQPHLRPNGFSPYGVAHFSILLDGSWRDGLLGSGCSATENVQVAVHEGNLPAPAKTIRGRARRISPGLGAAPPAVRHPADGRPGPHAHRARRTRHHPAHPGPAAALTARPGPARGDRRAELPGDAGGVGRRLRAPARLQRNGRLGAAVRVRVPGGTRRGLQHLPHVPGTGGGAGARQPARGAAGSHHDRRRDRLGRCGARRHLRGSDGVHGADRLHRGLRRPARHPCGPVPPRPGAGAGHRCAGLVAQQPWRARTRTQGLPRSRIRRYDGRSPSVPPVRGGGQTAGALRAYGANSSDQLPTVVRAGGVPGSCDPAQGWAGSLSSGSSVAASRR